MINGAKDTCRRMIAETQQRVDIMLEEAQRQAQEILARAHASNRTGNEFIRLMSDDNDEGDSDMGPVRLRDDSNDDEGDN